jgi:signal transduction histidine kinase
VAPFSHLHLRFAASTAVIIAVVGAALFWDVRRAEVRQAERDVTRHALYVEQSLLRHELTPQDVASVVRGERRRELDRFFHGRVLVGGGLRVKLYRAGDGLVTYSNVHSLIGGRADDMDEQREVLAGEVVRDVATLNHEGGGRSNEKALEVYVPLRLPGDAKPRAVFELYQSYKPVESSVRSFVTPFAVLLLGALLGLWIALFPLLRRMARALDRDRRARVTAEQALEDTAEQLRQSQKMEAIGRLAGGVAHDFNNLLLAINGYSELLAESVDGPEQRRFAEQIRAAGERAAGLTQQLLAFSRRQVLQPRVLDLNDCVREIDEMLTRLIGAGIEIRTELAPDLQPVEADPGQIGQVLLNLAVNARDAMGSGGTLTIRTRNQGPWAVLEVSDTGIGIDTETQSHIFDPFFTTKDVGEGTGLGLSTVYGIVTQSGGTMSVQSAPGEGATFVVRLPATAATPAPAALAPRDLEGGADRILVVDDEEIVRDLLARLLRGQGYHVDVAASAREARTMEGHYDLLITDVVMPETDGVQLAAELPIERVLFISGYDQNSLIEGDAQFLQKPFDRAELVYAVRAILDGEAALSPA